MSEDDKDSRTEEATEKRLRDAIAEGDTPQSRDFATLGSLLGLLACIALVVPGVAAGLHVEMRALIEHAGSAALGQGADASLLMAHLTARVGLLIAPVLLLLLVAGAGTLLVQNPPSFVLKRIRPNPQRMSLSSGWSRLLGAHGLIEAGKQFAKIAVLLLVSAIFFAGLVPTLATSMAYEPIGVVVLLGQLATSYGLLIGVLFLLPAIADLVWSRWSWRRRLRMTRQQVREEVEDNEPDPHMKGRRLRIARGRLRARTISNVAKATMVVANPTHFAVALRYVPEETAAPRVVAKGQDLLALRIRKIAEEKGIPVVENVALARALYRAADTDRQIPTEFYKAVAEIIIFLRRKRQPARPHVQPPGLGRAIGGEVTSLDKAGASRDV